MTTDTLGIPVLLPHTCGRVQAHGFAQVTRRAGVGGGEDVGGIAAPGVVPVQAAHGGGLLARGVLAPLAPELVQELLQC